MIIPRKLTQNFVETEVDGEVLLVDLDGGELFSLSGTARAVWRGIDGSRSVAEIATALAADYSAGPDEIESDSRKLIEELRQARLIA